MNTIVTIKDCDCDFDLYLFDPQESFLVESFLDESNCFQDICFQDDDDTYPLLEMCGFEIPHDVVDLILGCMTKTDLLVLSLANWYFYDAFKPAKPYFKCNINDIFYEMINYDYTNLLAYFGPNNEEVFIEQALYSANLKMLELCQEISPDFLYQASDEFEMFNPMYEALKFHIENLGSDDTTGSLCILDDYITECFTFVFDVFWYSLNFDLENIDALTGGGNLPLSADMELWINENGNFNAYYYEEETGGYDYRYDYYRGSAQEG